MFPSQCIFWCHDLCLTRTETKLWVMHFRGAADIVVEGSCCASQRCRLPWLVHGRENHYGLSGVVVGRRRKRHHGLAKCIACSVLESRYFHNLVDSLQRKQRPNLSRSLDTIGGIIRCIPNQRWSEESSRPDHHAPPKKGTRFCSTHRRTMGPALHRRRASRSPRGGACLEWSRDPVMKLGTKLQLIHMECFSVTVRECVLIRYTRTCYCFITTMNFRISRATRTG